MANFATSLLKACNPNPAKAGKTLLVLNALGMVFAAASNTFATAIDKNTSKEDKNFLVPAGVVTGVANIGLYYALTTKIINGLKNGAKASIDKMVNDGSFEAKAKDFVTSYVQKKETGLFKQSDEYISSMKQTLFTDDTLQTLSNKGKELFKDHTVAGAGVLGAFIGAVVGCAILTPIIRDVSAYFVQKRMEKTNPDWSQKPYRPYFDPSHIGDGPYVRQQQGVTVQPYHQHQPLSMKSYMLSTNGRTKI